MKTKVFGIMVLLCIVLLCGCLPRNTQEDNKKQYCTLVVHDGEGGGIYEKNSYISVNAKTIEGKYFVEWRDESGEVISESSSYSFFINQDATIQGIYADSPVYFSVTIAEDSIAHANEIEGEGEYLEGSQATLSAKDTPHKTFLYWKIGGSEIWQKTHNITLNGDIEVSAVFENCNNMRFAYLPESDSYSLGALNEMPYDDFSLKRFKGELSEEQFKAYRTDFESIKFPVRVPKYYNDGTNGLKTVTQIGFMAYSGCEFAESLILPETITKICGYAFWGCGFIESVSLNDGLEYIGENAFNNLDMLKTVSIPSSVQTIGIQAFSEIESIEVAPDNAYYSSQDGVLFDKNKSCLISFPMKSQITQYEVPASVKTIAKKAFVGESRITKISFAADSQLKTLEKNCFYRVTQLNGNMQIVLSAALETIGQEAFYNCGGIKEVAFENGSLLKHIEADAFYLCSDLSSISLPESLLEIGDRAFFGCDISEINTPESLTSIGEEAFFDCNLLNFSVGKNLAAIGNNVFGNNNSLITIKINSIEVSRNCVEESSYGALLKNALNVYSITQDTGAYITANFTYQKAVVIDTISYYLYKRNR